MDKTKEKLISADRLKKVIDKNFGHTKGAAVLAQLIDAQPPVITAESDWVPMTDRPPENGYWMWSAKGGGVEKDFYWDGHWEKAEKYGYEVLAWKPVPEAYIEGKKEAEKPDITKMVTISSEHISSLIMDQLDSDDHFWYSFARYKYENGWLIDVSDANEYLYFGLQEELANCFMYATNHGCDWLRIDKYGPVIPELECPGW